MPSPQACPTRPILILNRYNYTVYRTLVGCGPPGALQRGGPQAPASSLSWGGCFEEGV
jgi:hypothetical protein